MTIMNNSLRAGAAAAVAALALWGQARAQEDDATAAAEAAAKEATEMATPSASDMNPGPSEHSGSSHTELSSSASSFSLSVGAVPPPSVGPPPGWPGARPSDHASAGIEGGWSLKTADGGRSCTLRLSGDDHAWTGTGGPDGTLDISRFQYDGHTLVLTTLMGEPLARFRRVGGSRFEGVNVKTGEALVVTR